MKYTIEGFSQEYAQSLKKEVIINGKDGKQKTKTTRIDCTDLVILRWFVDFYPNMRKFVIDGCEYAWLSHNKLKEDLPILDISKRACIDRMQKLVDFGILKYKLIKEGGTFSLYTFGENYEKLIDTKGTRYAVKRHRGMQSNDIGGIRSNDIGGIRSNDIGGMQSNDIGGIRSNDIGGIRSNDIGVCSQTTTKDISIKDSSITDYSTKDNSNGAKARPAQNSEGEKKRKTFVPPTVEEVQDYCNERNNGIDAEYFCDYYGARGWELSKGRKVKDWKSCVRTWERNSYSNRKPNSQSKQPEKKEYEMHYPEIFDFQTENGWDEEGYNKAVRKYNEWLESSK